MSDAKQTSAIGTIEWCDLTVEDAPAIKDFYCSVVGWSNSTVPMGNYNDFTLNIPQPQQTIAGLCHARGSNSSLPAQWLMYVRVADAAASAAQCLELGGKVLDGPRAMGDEQFCVIQDPAGAVLALMSS